MLFVVISSGSTTSAPRVHLSILTAGVGGVFFPLGVELARLISAHVSNVEATAEISTGSVDNLSLIGTKRADIAFAQADVAYDAFKGLGPFTNAAVPARTLTPLYNSFTHLVTIEGKKINTLADLEGKRVSIGSPRSGTEATALRILQAGGLNPTRNFRKEQLGVGESVEALRGGQIDAFFWIGGLPTPAVLDLTTTPGLRIKLIALDLTLPELQRTFSTPSAPLYFRVVIGKEIYSGMSSPAPTVGLANLLLVHRDFDPELAYRITRLIYERRAELARAHKEGANITLIGAASRSPVPFHPGANRYFREQGVSGF